MSNANMGFNNRIEEAKAQKRSSRLSDKHNLHISLKQWKMLHAVVDQGSFAEAAEKLHVSQSAISYTIAKLQEQLGIQLLKIEGRKAQLTYAGKELLQRSRALINNAIEIEMFAEDLRKGQYPNIRLALHQDFPISVFIEALKILNKLQSDIKISLIEMGSLQVEEALNKKLIDLAISHYIPSSFIGVPLIELEYVAVACPSHPLFKKREISMMDLEHHIQVIVSADTVAQTTFSKVYLDKSQRWQVGSFDVALQAISEGIGYGWMPKYRVMELLNNGSLKILPLQYRKKRSMFLYLVYAQNQKPNSAVTTFSDLLQDLAEQSEIKNASKIQEQLTVNGNQ